MSTKRIAFITKFGWVGISSSVINSAIFWESKGYAVDIYSERPDFKRFPLPQFPSKKINFIITEIHKKFLFDDIFFRIKYFRKKEYKWIIGFDHLGLIRAGICSIFTKNKLVYHSLEFFEPKKKLLKNKIIKLLERLFASKAKHILTQDSHRVEFLKKDLNQNNKKIKIIFNSPIGDIFPDNSDYFREQFNIPKTKRIVLGIGSLIREHLIINLVDSLSKWQDEFVLVLHGWFPNIEIKNYVINEMKNFPNKLFISEKLFGNDEKYIPFQACDIGFVGFLPLNNNLKYAAGSAGKTFDFMRTGKPILAYKTPGMKELIEDNKVGLVFSEFKEIDIPLSKIKTNYNIYHDNCLKSFAKYEFNAQYDKFYRSVLRISL